jgi:C4-dicarboxylate-specific signal transduction histidine kinase
LLLRASSLLGSSLDVQEVLDTLMAQAVEVLGAERGFVMLRDDENAEWQFRSARALDADSIAAEDFRISRSVADRVAREGVSVLTSDAQQDARFNQQASIGLYNLRSILCVPLLIAQRVLGVLYLDNRLASDAFDRESRVLLEALASQAAAALENALLYEKLRKLHETSMEAARRELAATQAQLLHASKMAAVGQLAAGVAHEINNPLGAISLQLSGMRKQLGEHPAVPRLQVCETALERCKGIIQRLLRFAVPSPQLTGECAASELIDSTLLLLEPDLRRCEIQVQRQCEPGVRMHGQPSELGQLLLNLLLNARDALLTRPAERRLWVRARRAAEHAVLEVVDNGPGLAAEVQARMFEPFFTTKPVGEGVGLGLSICYQIVAQHGGTIQADSKPGEGTKFVVTLPHA